MDILANFFSNPRNYFLVFGSYTLIAIVFYYYPEIIPRKKKNKDYDFLVISHRGGSGENNENTLAAFKHSSDIGVDMLELDCHITKDGKVVVIHDNNLTRLCGTNKLVSDLNYEELPLILDEHKQDIFLEAQNDLKRTVSTSLITNHIQNRNTNHTIISRRITLLEEVFQQFPNMPINIDIKIDNNDLINKVNDLIIAYKREKLTVWGSFKESIAKKCYKKNNKIAIFFSLMGCVKLLFLMLTGLLPFVPLKESYLEVMMPNNLLKNKRDSIPKAMIAPLLLLKMFFVRKSLVRHLQKRGIFVFYWVLNTEEEFETAIELGSNGIITDYPTRLIEYIDKRRSSSSSPSSAANKRSVTRPNDNF